MTRVTCGKCGYSWEYKGKMTLYATCPNCRRAVKLNKEVGGGMNDD